MSRLSVSSVSTRPPPNIDFHSTQKTVACTASEDKKAIVWDLEGCSPIRTLQQHAGEVWRARFLSTEAYEQCLATASADGHVRLWDLRARIMVCALPAPTDQHLVVAAAAAQHLLAAATDRCTLAAWDLRTLRRLQHVQLAGCAAFAGEVTSMAFSSCGTMLALGSLTGAVLAADLERGTRQLVCQHDSAVHGLAWGARWPRPSGGNADVPYLLCASHDGSWSCWNAAGAVDTQGSEQAGLRHRRFTSSSNSVPGPSPGRAEIQCKIIGLPCGAY